MINSRSILFFIFNLVTITAFAQELPSRYTELLDFVQEAPNQGGSGTCLFVASTGAMELIANKKAGILNPTPYGTYDLAESFLIHAPDYKVSGKYFWERPILKFNHGFGIHLNDWPFVAWEGTNPSSDVWNEVDWSGLKKIELPKVDTFPLFVKGSRWSTKVLTEENVFQIKEALWKYKAPILVNYNDNKFWHVVLIVGYDDELPGNCYQTSDSDCGEKRGAFFVRDSFGRVVELRDYDWFRVKGNAAFVVREVE